MIRLLIVLILLFGLIAGVYLVLQQTSLFSKAAPSTEPKDVRISNLSDNAFTVSWVTLEKTTIGFINFGENDSLGQTAIDDRDQGTPLPRLTHHVTLESLDPATVYYFKINSGGQVYDLNGKAYQQKTAPITADAPPVADPLFGKVVKTDKTPVVESLIYSTIGSSVLLSSYTREDGNFLLTLNNARTKDLQNYLTVQDNDQVNLEVQAAEGSLQKQVAAADRQSAILLALESNRTVPEPGLYDFNKDGMVNAVDYADFVRRQLKL